MRAHFAGILATALLLIVVSPCMGQDEISAYNFQLIGDSAYASFQNQEALEAYQKALLLSPDNKEILIRFTRTHYDIGLDFLAEGDQQRGESYFEKSVELARKLVTLYPDDARTHLLVAVTLGNLAMFKGGGEKVAIGREVEKFSRQSIAIDSSFALPYVALGVYHRELASLNWLERSAARIIYGHLPKTSLDTALKYLRKAETLAPDHPFLHFEMAQTLAKQRKYDDAIHHMSLFEQLPPQTSQDIRNKRLAREAISQWKERVPANFPEQPSPGQ